MNYLFSKCCHYQQLVPDVVQHTAWCDMQFATDTYSKEFDTDGDMQEYVHEKYTLKIHKLLRE